MYVTLRWATEVSIGFICYLLCDYLILFDCKMKELKLFAMQEYINCSYCVTKKSQTEWLPNKDSDSCDSGMHDARMHQT